MMKLPINGKNGVSRLIANVNIPGCPTPMINLKVKTNKNELSTLQTFPDTGVSINCIDAKFVKKNNIEVLPETTNVIESIWAEGKAIKVLAHVS